MTTDEKALVLNAALLFAIRLRDAEGFRRWLEAGLDELGLAAVEALLLDEPSSGLDPLQRVQLRALLRDLASDGVAVLLSTHVLGEVEDLCDRVLVLHRGEVRGTHDLQAQGRTVQVTVARPDDAPAQIVRQRPPHDARTIEQGGRGGGRGRVYI